jgi:glycosidase
VQSLWFKNAVIYCLEVDVFKDGNGDGIGDFVGLRQGLSYLAGLGVTCIWLLPFFTSPDRDDGYDVTDYLSVDPSLGDFGDFVAFMDEARNRGIRVIIDLVVNHTSDRHPWFQQARRKHPKYYDLARTLLAYSLIFTIPGTPVFWYGDEIGMGEDLSLEERNSVRTPMQWTSERNGGFSTASKERLRRPVISKGPFRYHRVNVQKSRREPGSLLNRLERMIRTRKEFPESGTGTYRILETDRPKTVFAPRL